MKEWLLFIASISDVLYDIYIYAKNTATGGPSNEEYERQLAAKLIRKASDEEMKKFFQNSGGE